LAESKAALKDGDVVKIDLGTHVDGFAATTAHTVVVGAEKDKVTGKAANVIVAAWTALEAAVRLIKPGNKNSAVSDAIAKVAKDFKVNPVQGVLSHEMKRFRIDGDKVIINREDVDQKVDEVEFQPNEVYALDVVFSTGEGKPNEIDERTTIYKRVTDARYSLKRAASRKVFGEVLKKFSAYPFNNRKINPKTRAFGIKECKEHELITGYPVLFEKEGDLVAHFKVTILLLPSGPSRVTGLPLDVSKFTTTEKIKDESIVKLLASGGGAKKKKKKAKNKKKKADGAGAGAGAGGGGGGGKGKEDDEEEEDDDGEEEG